MKFVRYFIAASLIVLMIATGFLRGYLVYNTNLQLANELYQTDEYQVDDALSFINSFDYWTTYAFKWFLILMFCVIYWVQTHWILKFLFNQSYFWLVTYSFVFMLAITAVIYGGFALFGEFQKGYEVARYPLSWIQSPIPLMLLIPGLYLRRGSSKEA